MQEKLVSFSMDVATAAVIAVVLTCLPESPGYDLELHDDELIDKMLDDDASTTMVLTRRQVYNCRDTICQHFMYDFSDFRHQ